MQKINGFIDGETHRQIDGQIDKLIEIYRSLTQYITYSYQERYRQISTQLDTGRQNYMYILPGKKFQKRRQPKNYPC